MHGGNTTERLLETLNMLGVQLVGVPIRNTTSTSATKPQVESVKIHIVRRLDLCDTSEVFGLGHI